MSLLPAALAPRLSLSNPTTDLANLPNRPADAARRNSWKHVAAIGTVAALLAVAAVVYLHRSHTGTLGGRTPFDRRL